MAPYDKFCAGYGNPGSSGNGYMLGLVLGTGIAPLKLGHGGSSLLDEINAFDRAEVEETNIGQINMITVSSFCGPQGLIWGYDVLAKDDLRTPLANVSAVNSPPHKVPVYSIQSILDATQALFGTVKKPLFPLLPGSHVPCACKTKVLKGPGRAYAAIGIGIPVDRNKAACLLMEDTGEIICEANQTTKQQSRILQNLAQSIVEIGKNQRVNYREIFVGLKVVSVPQGHVGCALVAAPYFTLAREAIPNDINLTQLTWEVWEVICTNKIS